MTAAPPEMPRDQAQRDTTCGLCRTRAGVVQFTESERVYCDPCAARIRDATWLRAVRSAGTPRETQPWHLSPSAPPDRYDPPEASG